MTYKLSREKIKIKLMLLLNSELNDLALLYFQGASFANLLHVMLKKNQM